MSQASPNLLFVFSDQQRYSAASFNGNTVLRTPTMDSLARDGMVFDRCFSGHPLCAPYRASLLTGWYGWHNGVIDNEYRVRSGAPSFAGTLKSHGYDTAYIGKWHLGYGPYTERDRVGFDRVAAYDCGYGFYKTEYHLNEDGPIPFNSWAPTGETDLAIDYLREHAESGKPFGLFLAWAPPHWPYDEYPPAFRRLGPDEVDVPDNVPRQMVDFARREIADYYNCIEALDHELGRVLSALTELGLDNDTIVVFTSDHGDHLSSHGYGKPSDRWLHPMMRASKATPHEESIHVPFVVRYPGAVPAGARTERYLTTVDIMPSLLGLTGVPAPETDGRDRSEVFRGAQANAKEEDESAYLINMGPGWPYRGKWIGFWRGVRTERYVYARWRGDERGPLLYDRLNDPLEMHNLAGGAEFRPIQEEMEERLRQLMNNTSDPFESGKRDPHTGILQLGQEFVHRKWDNAPPFRAGDVW